MPKATAPQSVSIELLTEVIKCNNTLGEEQTVLLLKQSQFPNPKHKKISNLIIDVTCKQIRVTRAQVLKGSSRGDRPIAMMIIYVLHKQFLKFSNEEIAELFSKDKPVIRKYIYHFQHLSEQYRADADTLKKFNEISAIIKKQL